MVTIMNKLKDNTYYFVVWENSYVLLKTKRYNTLTKLHPIKIIEENYKNDGEARDGWAIIDYTRPIIYKGCKFIYMKDINDRPKNYNILFGDKNE